MEIEKIVSNLREYADKLEAAGFGMELIDTMREASDRLESAGWLSDIAAGHFSEENDNMTAQEYRESKLAEKWIKIKTPDSRPDDYKRVLLYYGGRDGYNKITVGEFDAMRQCWFVSSAQDLDIGIFTEDAPTYWQPLPPPPKEQTK